MSEQFGVPKLDNKTEKEPLVDNVVKTFSDYKKLVEDYDGPTKRNIKLKNGSIISVGTDFPKISVKGPEVERPDGEAFNEALEIFFGYSHDNKTWYKSERWESGVSVGDVTEEDAIKHVTTLLKKGYTINDINKEMESFTGKLERWKRNEYENRIKEIKDTLANQGYSKNLDLEFVQLWKNIPDGVNDETHENIDEIRNLLIDSAPKQE